MKMQEKIEKRLAELEGEIERAESDHAYFLNQDGEWAQHRAAHVQEELNSLYDEREHLRDE